MRYRSQFALLFALSCCALAQQKGPGEIRNVRISSSASGLQVEVILSAPSQPSVEAAHNPERLVLVLPEITSNARQRKIAVQGRGIKAVRFGLNSANPPVTHVVVELERMVPYALSVDGNRLVLDFQTKEAKRSAPPGAASAPWAGVFRRRPKQVPEQSIQVTVTPVPPPQEPPISFPSTVSKDSHATGQASSAPSPVPSPSVLHSGAPSISNPNQSDTASRTDASVFPGNVSPEAPRKANGTSINSGWPSSAQASSSPPVSGNGLPGAAEPVRQTTTTSPSPLVSAEPAAADVPNPALAVRTTNPDLRTAFKVKYVAEDAAYLDGGRSSGLAEGMKLEVRNNPSRASNDSADAAAPVAELQIISVAETSAVAEIHVPQRPVKAGDVAYLSSQDEEALVQKNALSATRKYPAVVSFTEGDTLDDEVRQEIPKPPLPSVNRARGRIGVDYMALTSHGPASSTSSSLGLVMRTDITRINGSYWNLSGYWRGRLTSQSSTGQTTLQDLINRTYHLGLTYENPQSRWVAGVGRLYLPWASSLDTIDGGYFGARIHSGATLGVFAGSTPDPTSWDYNPNRHIGGAFINFESGSFDSFRYTSTSGVGISTLKWRVDRPFIFFENTVTYKRYFSIYHSLEADSPRGNAAVAAPGPGIGRSFLTVRVQPHERLELDFNHTYFRDIPTFDPALIGTGLLDKYLFQGFSAGARVEVIKHVWAYTDLGLSNRSGDTNHSLNQMYGLTFDRVPWLGLRVDGHYSKFNSSFGAGSYEAFSVSRNLGESLRLEVLVGQQNFVSSIAARDRARFVTSNLELPVGQHYFFQGGFTTSRGSVLNYNQWLVMLGYRFDSKHRTK
ncbi:MAG TPA: AMIN domain-containing protein [Terriglobales bacterium]|nr:AMIN domain-containing protein [Terriglobales bacterium]